MPRYFFHTANGGTDRDTQGTELPDHRAARIHAIRYAGDVMSDTPDVVWGSRDFRVEVTDDRTRVLFTVITLSVDAPEMERGD